MSRAAVLASLSDQDAKAAEEFQLYDGTPLGTLQLVSMKEEIAYIRRNLPRGAQGYVAICKIIDSPALKLVLNDIATNEEREFLLRDPTRHRQGIVLSLIMARGGPWPWQASDE
jgi:hypothetical protein